MRLVQLIFLGLLSLSCEQQTCRETPAEPEEKINLTIVRTEGQLFNCKNAEEVTSFLEEQEDIALKFLHSDQYPTTDVLAGRMFQLVDDPYLDTLYTEAIAAFEANAENFESDLQTLYTWLNHYYPQEQLPVVKTMVTGLYNDMYVSDQSIIVGLDFFIGPEATFKPIQLPAYIQTRYTQRHVVPGIAKFIASSYSELGKENTLLSEMIDIGKVMYFTGQLLPCTPDSLIIGYDPVQMKNVVDNREIIWANLIENDLLYNTEEMMKQKFLGERPSIQEISKNCPGRVGAYLGWEIVQAYMDQNKSVTLQDLLAETDHNKIFRKSKYKPKNG
ncbi:MAG: hypothetical protein R8G66_30245 [Cytophagales bacterium]|nr:hypothetical protein [Cytophagales bacterium]